MQYNHFSRTFLDLLLNGTKKYTHPDQLVIHQGLWYEQGHPHKGLQISADSFGRNSKQTIAKMNYLQVLSSSGVFQKTNWLVMKWDQEAYHTAQLMLERVTASVPHYTHKIFGLRPFSRLTTRCNMPTRPHKDVGNDGCIPSVCARYGTNLQVKDG